MHLASFPGFPALEHKYVGRTGYIVSHEYEIIRKGAEFSEQKGDILYVLFIQLYIQGSLYRVFAPCQLDIWSKSPTKLRCFYSLSTLRCCSREKKNYQAFLPAQLQCSRSGAEEPGNETTVHLFHDPEIGYSMQLLQWKYHFCLNSQQLRGMSLHTTQRETIEGENFRELVKNMIFTEKTFADCSLVLRQRCHTPKFCGEKQRISFHYG